MWLVDSNTCNWELLTVILIANMRAHTNVTKKLIEGSLNTFKAVINSYD